jgi:uncharacterized protein (DUF2267 family)
MRYAEFIETVERVASILHDDAERAARATLETLGERLSYGEANDLAEELPRELRPWIHNTSEAQAFSVAEFLDRVARREGIAPSAAETHARAVFAALGKAVSDDELHDMASELPRDYGDLIRAAEGDASPNEAPPRVMPAEEFARRVAERTGLEPAVARDVTAIVTEMLGERITRGRVEDLAVYLPDELQAALERGNQRTRDRAVRMSLEQVLDGIAGWERVSREEARSHASALFQTLREAVPEKEFSDTLSQLPMDYRLELLERS